MTIEIPFTCSKNNVLLGKNSIDENVSLRHKIMNSSEKEISLLTHLTQKNMAEVNAIILTYTVSEALLVPEMARYLMESGGKRLRPMLTLAMALAADYKGKGHVKLATAVEFMHSATLLHDDVVDNSTLRRGKQAARLLWGNEASVLVGDFLLGQAFRLMVEVEDLSCLYVLSSAASIIAEGEVRQLSACKKLSLTQADYLQIIHAKTAELFSAACEVGPLLAKAPPSHVSSCKTYGLNLGLAFQLIDDALDYSGTAEHLGKNIGDDLREGRMTLPIILALRQSSPAERQFFEKTLGVAQLTEKDIARALDILTTHRAVENTIHIAQNYGDRAVTSLEKWPGSEWKEALLQVAEFCVYRKK